LPNSRSPSGASAEEASAAIEALTDVLIDCVQGGASVSFMWPLPRERALAFWRRVSLKAWRGANACCWWLKTAQGQIVGTVQLIVDLPDNQPHRADVAKMLVHRQARRRGVAQRCCRRWTTPPARRAARCWCWTR
jgi:GNAT superfamily N-acetyltransferase